MIGLSRSKRSPRKKASRTIPRSRSAADRHLAEASTDGPPIGTTRKCTILGASIILLRPLPRLRTFFPKGTMLATTCVTNTTAAKIKLKSNKQNHDSDNEERACNSRRTQSQDEEHHGLRRPARHQNAVSGSVIHLYTYSDSNKRFNNTPNDIMPRPRVSGTKTM